MLGNLTSYLTEKDWEELTKRVEACVERVLTRNNLIQNTEPCNRELWSYGIKHYCNLPKNHEGGCISV